MKLLALPCNKIKTKLTFKSTRQKGVQFVEDALRGSGGEWLNSTLIFVCAEEKDELNKKIAETSAKVIKSILKEMNSTKVVLVPFVHLSSNIAKPALAYRIIKEIGRRLQSEDMELVQFQFGWHRELLLDIIGSNIIKYKEI